MEDASSKYLVGQETSPMRNPKCTHCLLPDVTVRLESGERTSGELLSHVRTPPSVVSEYGPARSPASPWHTMPASRTHSADSARNRSRAIRHACLRLYAASGVSLHRPNRERSLPLPGSAS